MTFWLAKPWHVNFYVRSPCSPDYRFRRKSPLPGDVRSSGHGVLSSCRQAAGPECTRRNLPLVERSRPSSIFPSWAAFLHTACWVHWLPLSPISPASANSFRVCAPVLTMSGGILMVLLGLVLLGVLPLPFSTTGLSATPGSFIARWASSLLRSQRPASKAALGFLPASCLACSPGP